MPSGDSGEINGTASADPSYHVCAAATLNTKRKHKVRFGEIEYHDIPHLAGADKKPNISHNLSYSHPSEMSLLDNACEAETAVLKALSWH